MCGECAKQMHRPDRAHGLCNTCYQRHRRRGDTAWAREIQTRQARRASSRIRKLADLDTLYTEYWQSVGLLL